MVEDEVGALVMRLKAQTTTISAARAQLSQSRAEQSPYVAQAHNSQAGRRVTQYRLCQPVVVASLRVADSRLSGLQLRLAELHN